MRRRPTIDTKCRNVDEADGDDDQDDDDYDDHELNPCRNDDFEESILTLRGYSFVSVNNDKTAFAMHGRVQLATRKRLEPLGQLERWKQQFTKNLGEEFPTGEYENWAKCQELFPNAKAAMA